MQFNQITYFLRVCDTLNFTRAAEVCHVSQPSLSAAIKKLEDELGGALFERKGRAVQMTKLGEAMRVHLGQIEQAKKVAGIVASNIVEVDKHTIDLGFMCTLSPDTLIEAVATFSHENQSELLIHDVWQSKALELLLAGALDCIIMAHTANLPERFNQQVLTEEPMLLATNASNALSNGSTVSFQDLQNQKYVDRLRCEFREFFFKELDNRNCDLQVVMRSEREDVVRESVAEGVGISIMPRSAAEKAGLCTIAISDMPIVRRISIVTVRDREMHASTNLFIQHVCTAYAEKALQTPA